MEKSKKEKALLEMRRERKRRMSEGKKELLKSKCKRERDLSKLSIFERARKVALEIPAQNIGSNIDSVIHACGPGPHLNYLCRGHMFSAGVFVFTYKEVTCKDCRKYLGYDK